MNRIKELREEKRMTQVRLSIELEVSQESVSAYEKGKCYPSYQTLVKLSRIFGASIDYIMGLSDRMLIETPLTHEDEVMLSAFRKLDSRKKERVISYIEGISEL